jgi:DNA polymerase-3 subunit delta
MLYILHGRDDFSRREELGRIKASLDSDGMLTTNTDALDGREVTLEQLTAICGTIPFLGSHRLVVVEGLLGRFESDRPRRGGARPRRGPGADLERWLALAEAVQVLPASTTLVFLDDELSAGNPLLEALRPHAEVREFRELKPGAVLQWVMERAQNQGIDISPTAAKLLAELVGNKLWVLASELDKLAAYAQGRRIEGADVKALVSAAREVNVFAMVDAVVEGRAPAARLLRQQGRGAQGLSAGHGGPPIQVDHPGQRVEPERDYHPGDRPALGDRIGFRASAGAGPSRPLYPIAVEGGLPSALGG